MKYKKIILILLITIFLISDDEYISASYKKIFSLRKQQADISRDYSISSTIKPINISTSYASGERNSKNSNDLSASISYRQDFFKSGAIWRAIDIAKINHRATYFNINKDKRNSLYDIYALSLQLRILDLEILKQEHLLKNAIITYDIKKENYINGLSDITQLDSATISINDKTNTINDFKNTKNKSLKIFKNISNTHYENIKIPKLNIPSMEVFLSQNNINNEKNTINMKNKNIQVTRAKYLPTASLNLNYGYNDNDLIEEASNTNYSLGVSISMNVDIFSTSSNIQKEKISLLLSKSNFNQKQKEQKNLYTQMINHIKIQKENIELSKKSAKKYESLVSQIKELYKNGARTKDDLDIALNTKKIKTVQSDIFELKNEINIINLHKQGSYRETIK